MMILNPNLKNSKISLPEKIIRRIKLNIEKIKGYKKVDKKINI